MFRALALRQSELFCIFFFFIVFWLVCLAFSRFHPDNHKNTFCSPLEEKGRDNTNDLLEENYSQTVTADQHNIHFNMEDFSVITLKDPELRKIW